MSQHRIEGRAYLLGSSRQITGVLLCRKTHVREDQPSEGRGQNRRKHREKAWEMEWEVEILDQDYALIARVSLSEIRLEPPLGNLPRRMTLPDGTLFETDDHAAIKALPGQASRHWLHGLEQFRPRLAALVAATALSIWAVWRYGIDMLVAAAIGLTPAVVIEQLDKGALQYIDSDIAYETRLKPHEQQETQAIFDRLLLGVEDAPESARFKLLFRYMPFVGANALALPGGTIIMTDDLVEQFPEPDILAGVLGHEIGHVTEQHGLKGLYRSLVLYILLAFISIDTGPMFEELLAGGNLLLTLQYGRENETAADNYGVRLAHAAGYDANGVAHFFEKMMKEQSQSDDSMTWLSTHPPGEDRVEAIHLLAKALQGR